MLFFFPFLRTKITYCCVFIGYSSQHKGYRCLHPSTRRVYISRHVLLNESKFPFENSFTASRLLFHIGERKAQTIPPGIRPVKFQVWFYHLFDRKLLLTKIQIRLPISNSLRKFLMKDKLLLSHKVVTNILLHIRIMIYLVTSLT